MRSRILRGLSKPRRPASLDASSRASVSFDFLRPSGAFAGFLCVVTAEIIPDAHAPGVPYALGDAASSHMSDNASAGRFGHYLATVTENRDPEQRGRVRVHVPSINARDALPTWALPLGQNLGGDSVRAPLAGAPRTKPARGLFTVPAVGAQLVVVFLDGHVEHPMWMPGPMLANEVYPEVKSREGATSDAYPWKSMLRGRSLKVVEHELGDLDVSMEGGREVRITTNGARFVVRTLPDNAVVLNDGAESQLAARVGDEVDIGDFTFTGVFNPSNGALTSLTITFPGGATHTINLASPSATFSNLQGRIATGAPKVWIGGTKTRL